MPCCLKAPPTTRSEPASRPVWELTAWAPASVLPALRPTTSGIATVAEREAEQGNSELAGLITEKVVAPQGASIQKAYRMGIKIGCGTDTLGDMVQEIEILHRCGIPKAECIKAATSVAADILGKSNRIGTIEPGKTADCLLVRGNPLKYLNSLRNIHTVIKDGEIMTADRMIQLPGE